ncbi:hypothetical protein NXW13_13795 [Bacteroides thetaiotaomicron]|nr:hypothetical protein [Bacteroides thetaiotaomicron]
MSLLSVNIYPASMALTGNPIKLSISSSSRATYTISADGKEIFTGSGEGDFFVFLQDILADVVRPAQLYNESEKILLQADSCAKSITINVSNANGETKVLYLNVFIGGVSKRMLRHLHEENKSVFLSEVNESGSELLPDYTNDRKTYHDQGNGIAAYAFHLS